MNLRNLFSDLPESLPEELCEPLLRQPHFKLERIVSAGQATPLGEWLDQDANEWVVLLAGRAELRFEGDAQRHLMGPGDYVHIGAHHRHRVEWTDPDQRTVWLALHYSEAGIPQGQ